MLILLIFLITIPVYAVESNTGVISEELREKMKTQEVILERIIRHYDKDRILVGHNVSSYYINGYGVLFELQRFPQSEFRFFDRFGLNSEETGSKYTWSEEKKAIVRIDTRHGKDDEIELKKMVQKILRNIRLGVFEFLADYFSPIQWLDENEKVYFHFDINVNKKIPQDYDRQLVENVVPISWQATVKMSDLVKFNEEKISVEQLDKKIKIDLIYLNNESYSNKILGDVINSAVRSIKDKDKRPFSLYTTSINISDMGALFFLVTQFNYSESSDFFENFFENLFRGQSKSDAGKNSEEKYAKLLEELKFRLAKSVGQYGHKIKNVQENQWIILIVNIGRHGSFKSRFVMKFQKKNIDAYANNVISLEEFWDTVQIFNEELYN